jgi:hypothetical protein
MVDDWSGGEGEGDNLLPSLEEILHGPGFDQEEYDRQLEEAFAELNSEIDLDLGIDPFAEDADLLEYDDPFADDEPDVNTMDFREMTAADFEGDHRGPFPSFGDAAIYGNELPLTFWDIVYDDLDDLWYIFIPPSP